MGIENVTTIDDSFLQKSVMENDTEFVGMNRNRTGHLSRGQSSSDENKVNIECHQYCTNKNEIKMNQNILNNLIGGTCSDKSNITTKLDSRCKSEFLGNTSLSNQVLISEAKSHPVALSLTAAAIGLLILVLLANFACKTKCRTKCKRLG